MEYVTDSETGETYQIEGVQPLSVQLPTSVQQKQEFTKKVREEILEGRLNPLEFYRQAKLISDSIEELKKDPDILDCAQTEIAKYGKEKPKINGSTVEMGSRATPDYTSCEDSVYNDLKEQLKKREAFLKAQPPGGSVDPESGAFIKPPTQKLSTFVTVKI